MTYDELAVMAMMAGKKPGSPALAAMAARANGEARACPDCGGTNLEENFDGSSVACADCGVAHEAEDVEAA